MESLDDKVQARDATADGAGFALLWEGSERGARGPKPAFSLEEIVNAAIGIAEQKGLAAVTMNLVAKQLGVTSMALYRYVPGKDALVDLMADHIMGGPPDLTGTGWRENISVWSRANLALVLRHPWLFDVVSTRAVAGPNWARWLDAGLHALADLPFSVSEKMSVLMLVDGHFRASAQLLVGAKSSEDWANSFGRLLQVAANDERFPTLGALAATGGFGGPGFELEAMIDFGFERLLEGIGALVDARSGDAQ